MFNPCRIKVSKHQSMKALVDGQWWNVVEYSEVNSGIRVFFEDKTTVLIPHEEVYKLIKVKIDTLSWSWTRSYSCIYYATIFVNRS